MGETHEIPHHNLADFEPWLEYATEGQAVGGIPLENTSEGPQYHPQLHLLHSTTSKNPHAMAEMGKLDHLEERLRAIEGGEDYAFANLEELFLVPISSPLPSSRCRTLTSTRELLAPRTI